MKSGIPFFKMKHLPVNSGPLRVPKPPQWQPDPMKKMLEELAKKAEEVNNAAEAAIKALEIIIRGGGSVSIAPVMFGPPCFYNPSLPCGGPPEL